METKSGYTIMIIDDDLDTVNLLRLVFQRNGFRVFTATNWEEVIDRLRMVDNIKAHIDLIILDLMMPDKSGFEVMLSLRVILHPVPPVVILSAKTGVDDMVKASDMGAAKYLTKPTTKERLLATVNDLLGLKK